MQFKLLTTTAIAAVTLGSSAIAQELSYGGLMGTYSAYSFDGTDATVTVLAGEAGIRVDDFDMWISGYQAKLGIDGVPVNLTSDSWTIGAGYTFNNVFRLDVSSSDFDVSIGGAGLGIGMTELGAAYDDGTFFGRLSYAELDQDFGIDSLFGIMGGYRFSANTEIALSVHFINEEFDILDQPIYILTANHDAGVWSVELDAASARLDGTDLSLVSIGGEYAINDMWSVYGGYTNIDLDFISLNTIRIGGAYDVGDYRLFADYSVTDSDVLPDSLTGISFGVSMDFGDKPTSYQTTSDRLLGIASAATGYKF